MTHSDRPGATPKPAILHRGKLLHRMHQVQYTVALSDTLIALVLLTNNVCLADISQLKETAADETKAADREIRVIDVISDHPKLVCVSPDKQLLVTVSDSHVSTWNLSQVKTIENFKEIKPHVCPLDNPFLRADVRYDAICFVGKNSHVYIETWNEVINRAFVSLIDISNGNRISAEKTSSSDVCAFGEKRILRAQASHIGVYDIEFKDQSKIFSKVAQFMDVTTCGIDKIAVTSSCTLLAVKDEPTLGNTAFCRRMIVTPDLEVQPYGEYKTHRWVTGLPFFTCDESLVFCDEQHRTCVLESASMTPQVFHAAEHCCAFPNGNILEINNDGVFHVIRGNARHIYEMAIDMLTQALEVGSAVPQFPGDIGQIVVGYAAERGLFGKSARRHAEDKPFEHSVLGKIVDRLLAEPMILESDKDVLRTFMVSLQLKNKVAECAEESQRVAGISEGLRDVFFAKLRLVFAPDVGNKLKV